MPTTPQPIISTIFADINVIVPNFSSLVASYRLLVGAAEEIHRTPNVPNEIFQRAVERFDHAGTLIDILLELLCCKITFSSDFLSVTCAPVDIFRLLSNRSSATDTPFRTAEQILELEVLRRALERYRSDSHCFSTDSRFYHSPVPPTSSEAVRTNNPKSQEASQSPPPKDNEVLDELSNKTPNENCINDKQEKD